MPHEIQYIGLIKVHKKVGGEFKVISMVKTMCDHHQYRILYAILSNVVVVYEVMMKNDGT